MADIEHNIDKKFKREKMKHKVQSPPGDILTGDMSANLKRLLIMKADKMDIEKLYEIKSNKAETDNMIDVQTMMHKQFKHILVLFIELLNIQSVKSDDTRGVIEKRQ